MSGRQLDQHFTRHRVCHAEPAAEVFERVANAVEQRDHRLASRRQACKVIPFADRTIAALADLDERATAEAREVCLRIAIFVDEPFVLPGFYLEPHDVVRSHDPRCSLPTPRSTGRSRSARVTWRSLRGPVRAVS